MDNSDLEQRYGPNWRSISEYVEAAPTGFLFENMGNPHVNDATVRRVRDWDELRQVTDYSFDDASYENCDYLRFLWYCDKLEQKHLRIAERNGLFEQRNNAVGDAVDRYVEKGKAENRAWLDFVFSEPYDKPYPYCRFSVQDHCGYVAAELAVAHLIETHVFAEMWFWYCAGHWPCGWEGDWPDGRLIVF